jgi:hypothetical protein
MRASRRLALLEDDWVSDDGLDRDKLYDKDSEASYDYGSDWSV